MEENISILKNRSVIKIFGKDNESFLNSIFTNDINLISQNDVIPSALLSPQGKIIFDVLIFNLENSNYDEKTIFLECDNSQIQELIKKLKLYSLRQDVFIQETSLNVLTTNQANKFKNIKLDKRFNISNFGRLYLEKEQLENVKTIKLSDNLNWYNKLKFLKCVPEGSCEIPINKIFPFEINMIFEKAVCFKKGCFIGQEVIARVKYKGKIKKNYFAFKVSSNKNIDLKSNILNKDGSEIGKIIYNVKIDDNIFGFFLLNTKFIDKNDKKLKCFNNNLCFTIY